MKNYLLDNSRKIFTTFKASLLLYCLKVKNYLVDNSRKIFDTFKVAALLYWLKVKSYVLAKILKIYTTVKEPGLLFWASWSVFLCTLILIIMRMLDAWEIFLPDVDDNARYFLSAVAQALASLYALVITVSLIIMQLLTQTYTSAIFDIYVRRVRVLVSFIVAGFVICFSLYVLLQVQNGHVCHQQCIEADIILVLVAFSVAWNFIYFFDLLSIVKPENFLKIIEFKLNGTPNKKEILTLIGDICNISMKKGDLTTSKSCLSIFEHVIVNLDPEDKVHLSDILKKLFEKAIENDTTEMISAILGLSFYQPMMHFWQIRNDY